MSDVILVVNTGSSSIKVSVYRIEASDHLALLAKGNFEGIGTEPRFRLQGSNAETLVDRSYPPGEVRSQTEAMPLCGATLRAQIQGVSIAAAGHRVVHGGLRYSAPAVVDSSVLDYLESLIPLAPLHQPHNLQGIRALLKSSPEAPQVACFDTAFHRGHPDVADVLGLPYEYYERGVRRFGFHGLSYEYIAGALREQAPEVAAGKVVVAHLGSGASLCALDGGRSIDSTMSFTALDGLPMGTRPGALDAGAVLHVMKQDGLDTEQMQDLLYKRSGLLGLSGISNDMRTLLASDEPRARLAVEFFVYRVAKEVAALGSSLGGLNAVVFTAGIGERSVEVRERICRRLSWLGIALDTDANVGGGPRISADGSSVSAWVIPTDEELMVAHHTLAALRARNTP